MRGRRGQGLVRGAASIAFAAAILPGGAAGASDTDLVRRLFTGLDVPGEIAAVAPGATARLGDVSDVPAADRLLLRRIVETGFDPAALERRALAAFVARFDLEHARAAAAWLARPETARLHAAGRAPAPACEPTEADRAGPRAIALAHVAAATSVESRARRHAAFVLGAMIDAASAALPAARRLPGNDVAALLRAHGAEAAERRADACRYRDFSTDELVAAQAFLAGETGRWLYGSASAAVEEALARAARATALRIVDTFGGPRGAPVRVARAAPIDPAGVAPRR